MTHRVPMDSLLLILSIIAVISIALLFIGASIVYTMLFVSFLIGASLVTLAIWVLGSVDRLREFEKWSSGETHPILYRMISKEVEILNDKFDALITYEMSCRRNPKVALKQLKHEIYYDGENELEEVRLDGKIVKPSIEKFITRKRTDHEEIEIPLPNRLKLILPFSSQKAKADEFEYSYRIRYNQVYRFIEQENKEFTGHTIILPARWLTMTVRLPSDGKLFFKEKGIYVKVLDKHEAEDFEEENRVSKKYAACVSDDRLSITWDLWRPKLACDYRLYMLVTRQSGKVLNRTQL